MSLAIIRTRARLGIQAPEVTVEVHLSNGLPSLSIVGLPETVVKESKDRVRSALINSQFEFPARRITINLAPADLPKDGSRFDLAIAIGILAASGQIATESLHQYEFIGELALSGEIRPVEGILAAAISCGQRKRALIVSTDNHTEGSLAEHTCVYGSRHLLDVCGHLMGRAPLKAFAFAPPTTVNTGPDLADVQGQDHARRALEIAAAGAHNLLLYGPPGTGKTMLASRLAGILPPLSQTEATEVACIHSLCGHKDISWQTPPFRAPHHTASAVALVGGGSRPKPGEISLAHRGVLFLDELPEFQRQVVEVLREPLESGEICISRASSQLTFPAKFQLIAAMNPCPCGYLGAAPQAKRSCTCTAEQVQRYRQKISGPLLDRIDLQVAVNRLAASELSIYKPNCSNNESSATVRQRVLQARLRQLKRQGCVNAQLTTQALPQFCQLGAKENQFLQNTIEKLDISVRSYHRVIKVARTIADLHSHAHIRIADIAEALSLRQWDRN
ncbi:MAG: YifB family Mg chelatase-like AAA ATPase [Cellvibrionaceae bacterium]|nr:YifB family Mg chelatase-like AAA ATPase [Cellvibrionaceae bacterium]